MFDLAFRPAPERNKTKRGNKSMAGPAVHHIIGKEYLNTVLKKRYTDPNSTLFWDQMDFGKLAPVYHLGCQGPDFLFFNSNDWPLGGAIKPIAATYLEVMEFIDEFKKTLKELIPEEILVLVSKLESLAEDAVERSVLLSEISDLIGDVQNNMNALTGLVESKIKEFVTDSVDVFNLLSHPQQHGQKFNEWWWFDTLHIRRSGRFLRELLLTSPNNSMERAFALGYLTHYATDIVGHPYVNAMSGGPYRTHSQRHKVIENHHDVWAYQKYMKDEFVKSNLAKEYIIDGNSFELPGNLKKYILKCVEASYYKGGNPLYGREMDGKDLDISYSLWLKWFTMTTNETDLPEPQPYSLSAEIAEAWDKFTDNVGDIGDMVGSAGSGSGGILSLFALLAAAIVGAILLAAAIIDFLAGTVATMGAAPIRFFLSLTYEALYNAYMSFRTGVVLNGFAFPYQTGLSNQYTKHMLQTDLMDKFGHNANSLPAALAYPSRKYVKNGMKAESHLIYPWPYISNLEKDQCTGFPANYFKKTPEWYMTDPKHICQRDHYEFFKRFEESNLENPPAAEVELNFQNLMVRAKRGGLGNALSFSEMLYGDFIERGADVQYGDFSMDSDRGYGFKSWRKVKNITLINSTVNDTPITNVAVETDGNVPNENTDIILPYGGVL